MLKRKEHDAQRLGARRPEQCRHRQLVESGEEDEQRARGGSGRHQRKDDRAQASQQARTRDLRCLLQRAVELVVAADHRTQTQHQKARDVAEVCIAVVKAGDDVRHNLDLETHRV